MDPQQGTTQRENIVNLSERRVGLIGGMLTAIGAISLSIYTPAMPVIAEALQTSESAVKLSLTLYFAGFSCAQLICGPLSDAFGRRPIIFLFMLIYVAGSILAFMAPNIHVLIAARLIQGIGAAVGITISRALVRDLFTGDASARVMNFIGMILAIGPATAPIIGSLAMYFLGWRSIFAFLVIVGITVIIITILWIPETGKPDRKALQPKRLLSSYYHLLISPFFMLPTICITMTTGAIYAAATMQSFILINAVGMTAQSFAFGMLLQTAFFFAGTMGFKRLMPLLPVQRIVIFGFTLIMSASIALFLSLLFFEPNYWSVMLPFSLYVFGIAFVMPPMLTAAMTPFPQIAGSASALIGFFQMGGGMLGGIIAVIIGKPILAMAIIIPVMGCIAIASYSIWLFQQRKLRIVARKKL